MKKQVTCIVCPRGCRMTAQIQGDQIQISGNLCKRGETHAIGECTNPVRTVTSTVRVDNRPDTMVPVKTSGPIPKGEMFAAMEKIRSMRVSAPLQIGDVLCQDLFGTQLVATGDVQ